MKQTMTRPVVHGRGFSGWRSEVDETVVYCHSNDVWSASLRLSRDKRALEQGFFGEEGLRIFFTATIMPEHMLVGGLIHVHD